MAHKKERSEETAFKNLIGSQTINLLSRHFQYHEPGFNKKRFLQDVQKLSSLELKQRIDLIAKALKNSLPQDYLTTLDILIRVLLEPAPKLSPLRGFNTWPLFHFIQLYGHDSPRESLEALKKITSLFSAEYAIRPYIRLFPSLAYKTILSWTSDQDEHVRRLCSEGTRPRLPWGEVLRDAVKSPKESLKILDRLILDTSPYVQKSVANHLNDISKDHPDVALQFAQKWIKKAKAQNKVEWILKHGLRSLIKDGHLGALQIFGFGEKPSYKKSQFRLKKQIVQIGDQVEFEIFLEIKKNQSVLIDYAIHFLKNNGTHSKKVFKLTQKNLEAQQLYTIVKRHSFKLITTRTYYPGKHFIEIFINGHSLGKEWFTLKA